MYGRVPESGWVPIFPVCDWTGGVKRGRGPNLPELCSLYASQLISDRPVRLGFPHRAGRCRSGRTRLSSPGCRSRGYAEGCMHWAWYPILCGAARLGGSNGDVYLSSPGYARSTRPSKSAIGPWGWGFHTVRGGVHSRYLDLSGKCGRVGNGSGRERESRVYFVPDRDCPTPSRPRSLFPPSTVPTYSILFPSRLFPVPS